tara:strand:- start:1187 stop:2695 length:1509 start_codon:yes stop_codon:yes gene_type:complete
MDMERSIPKSINYQDVLPVAVPAIARRQRFFPQGGASGFNFTGTREIRIEIQSVNALLDPQHSYLEMFVNNTTAQTVAFDIGGGHVLFDEVRVEQMGRVLAREQFHNRLHAGILSQAQTSYDGQMSESINQQQRALNNAGGGVANKVLPIPQGGGVNGDVYALSRHNDQPDLGAGNLARITMAMPTGLFTQDKLIPLPLVSKSNPITLVFLMTQSANVGSWNAAPAAGGIQIDRMNYVAQLIEVGSDVIGQMRMMQEMGGGQLTISGQDFEHSSDVIPANSTGEIPIRIPARKKSIKSLFFQINSEDFTQGGGFGRSALMNLSYAGNANMNSYQMKVGSVTYPPTAIQCWGNCGRAAGALRPLPNQERGECAMELAKALGSLGFTNPTGRLSTITYGASTVFAVGVGAPALADGDNGDGAGNTLTSSGNGDECVCPFGLDLQSFQHTAIESGVDSETMAMETTLLLNIDAVTSGIEDKNVHCYLLFDQHYYFNADGSITFSN